MPLLKKEYKNIQQRTAVILSRPVNPENIGLVARCMKNTGFSELRLVMDEKISARAYVTAVHAEEILDQARLYNVVEAAVSDLDIVFAAVARHRKNFPALSFYETENKIREFPPAARLGLLFGNERSGLGSDELCFSNFRFSIPQAEPQPSYNLASAVLLTLFSLSFQKQPGPMVEKLQKPLSRKEQEECCFLILDKLTAKKFIHPGNRTHVKEMVFDLFGRLTMTERDRQLLLAIFSKGPDSGI